MLDSEGDQMQELLYKAIFNHIKSAVAIAGPDTLLDCNSAFRQLFGLAPDAAPSVLAGSLLSLLPASGAGTVQCSLPDQHGRQLDLEISVSTVNQAERVLLLEINPRVIETYREMSMLAPYTRELFGRFPDAVVLIDNDSRIMDLNPGFEQLFGYKRAESIGMDLDSLIVPEADLPAAKELFRKVISQEKVQVTLWRKTSAGSLVEVQAVGYPVTIDRKLVGNYVIYKDLSAQREAERRLREQEDFLEQLFNRSLYPIAILDMHETVLDVNDQFSAFFGYTRDEAIGSFINILILPPGYEQESLSFHDTIFTQHTMNSRTVRRNKSGALLQVEAVGSPVVKHGVVVGMFAMYRDISSEEFAIQSMRRENVYFQQLFDNTPSAVVLTDQQALVRKVNKPFERLFGYTQEETLGRNLNDLIVAPERMQEAVSYSNMVALDGKSLEIEAIRTRRDGTDIDVAIIAFPILLDQSHLGAYVIYMDISERKRKEHEIERLLYRDTLTGLYNRAFAYMELGRRIEAGRRFGERDELYIIYIDFDRFKEINDDYGHQAGDEVLRVFAQRMKDSFGAKLDICRVGGDEFLCISRSGAHSGVVAASAPVLVNDIERLFDTSADIEGHQVSIELSIGRAGYPSDGTDVDTLISAADARMYARKKIRRITANPLRHQASIQDLLNQAGETAGRGTTPN
ncbi:MAG: PAS domain S-box protein [Spirochaetes bacterium]|nr:PAS domain S-box protein [Spirochaetota bacterium]MBU0955535.1 PAS domain S-box protein [Spirochaetota bacterium]